MSHPTPKTLDLASCRAIVGDEEARKVEHEALNDADSPMPWPDYHPRDVAPKSYWARAVEQMRQMIYQTAFDARVARHARSFDRAQGLRAAKNSQIQSLAPVSTTLAPAAPAELRAEQFADGQQERQAAEVEVLEALYANVTSAANGRSSYALTRDDEKLLGDMFVHITDEPTEPAKPLLAPPTAFKHFTRSSTAKDLWPSSPKAP